MTASLLPGARRALGQIVREARLALHPGREVPIETIAERAGVGAAWYGWLEEGKNIGLSAAALGWIADALALPALARAEILRLSGVEIDGSLKIVRAEPVPELMRRLLDGFTGYPAYVVGQRHDVLVWNHACEALYNCSTIAPSRRNLFVFMFGQPEVRKLVVNWEEQARQLIGDVKVRLTEAPNDPWLDEVRVLLHRTSADFRVLWREVRGATDRVRVKVFDKGRLGRLSFASEDIALTDAPLLRLRVYVPSAEDGTTGRFDKVLARHHRGASARRTGAQYAAVWRIKEHLVACYAREVSLDELASLVGLSKFQMVRTFAEEVGFPPHAYQTLVRIHHARRLLLDGESAASVAAQVGFVDQSHFIRHFKRLEGMTPSAYLAASRRRVASLGVIRQRVE